MKRWCPLLLSALFLWASLSGQAAAPPRGLTPAERQAQAIDRALMAEALRSSELMANLTYLSDVIGPRLTGSARLKKANEWAAEKMRSYGLTDVKLEPWLMPEGWERGMARARVVEPDNGREVTLASMAWRPGTKGKVVGDVVALKAQSMKELDTYRGKLKNAIILTGAPRPVPSAADIERPGPRTPRGAAGGRRPGDFGRRSMEDLRAFQQGRDAFLVKEGVAAILQASTKPLGLITTGGSWTRGDRASATNRLPTLVVAHNHYEMLYRLATRNDSTKVGEPVRTRMEIEVENRFIPGPIKVFNTVGEIRGSEKPNEYVVVGAHLDSWDLGTGTTDNGTGSSIILEVARMISRSGIKPKRTIRFVLFTGEEQGLHGSRHYVQQHKDEMARTSAALVHDVGTGRVIGIGAGGFPALVPQLRRELVSLFSLGVTDYQARSLGGSDHASFSSEGVPGFLMVQEPAGYFLSHHTQADTMDRVRPADLVQGAQVIAVAAMRIANLDELLPRQRSGGRRIGR